jgi:putative transposase
VLAQDDLLPWCLKLGLLESTRTLITSIRTSEPVRRVGGGKANVVGRYPSQKMGRMIQFESHRVELAFVLEFEHDPHVVEYYDQPGRLPLRYIGSSGRRVTARHTPDYFVLRSDSAGWEECKTDEELAKLAEKSPNRYRRESGGAWCCPPGEAYAAALGLYYRVRNSGEICWTFQRNIHFLADYLRHGVERSPYRDRLLAFAERTPGVGLKVVLETTTCAEERDCLYSMIARGELHVDLRAESLWEPENAHLFPDRSSAELWKTTNGVLAKANTTLIDLQAGDRITWDTKEWIIANAGATMLSLIGPDRSFIELPAAVLEDLIKGTRVQVVQHTLHCNSGSVRSQIAGASEADLKIANRRSCVVRCHLLGERPPGIPARTVRLWAARFREAELAFGEGYLGLIPRTRNRGNRHPRISGRPRALMAQFIEKDYETHKQKTKYASWIALKLACEREGVVSPSYRAFLRAVKLRDRFTQTMRRKGRRAAYSFEPQFWDLEMKTPRHGDRPFEVGHIDHTELDVEVRCSVTGRSLGRPWLTILVDAFARRVLAKCLIFDAPSYRSCMLVLRDCVKRHSRLPQVLVLDGGREFDSTYFETLLARYECTKKTRPPAKARFGSVCERLFGTTNTQFIHNLRGNTQITRNVRQVTESVDPKRLAVWSLAELNASLDEYLFEVYDQMDHPTLAQSPREAFNRGMDMSGLRLQRMIRYEEDFLICTLPTTAKGTAKIVPGRGVKIHHVYYWSDELRDPELECRQVPVRYDPYDIGMAYAFCRNRWIRCHSEFYVALQGRSEREVSLATRELRRRRQQHPGQRMSLNAKALARFLESVECQETLLLQRLRDRESTNARNDINRDNGLNPPKLEPSSDPPGALERNDAPFEIYGEF